MATLAVETEIEAIHSALQSWIGSVEGRDVDRLAEIVSPDESLVWIGAGAEDWLCGFKALERAMVAQNDAFRDIQIQVSDETIHWSSGEISAWATNRWIFKATVGDQSIAFPLRCTWILTKGETGWKIVHFHKSVGMVG